MLNEYSFQRCSHTTRTSPNICLTQQINTYQGNCQQPKVDLTLFIRPFRTETWYGILVVFLVVCIVLILSRKAISAYGTKSGYKIVILISWVSFVLINAYFGGALTMFFTSDVQLPFENLREVLQNIPDWKLVSITEMKAIYKIPATEVFSFNYK